MVLNYRMRFYLVLFFCVSVFLCGCSDDKGIPKGIIEEPQMASLLTDIHLVDGSLYNLPPVPDTLAKHGLGLYLAVLKMHHTDTTQFKESMKFYTTRPDLMTRIYFTVTKTLDSLQAAKTKAVKPVVAPKASQKTTQQITDSVNKAQALEKKKADSIKAVQFKLAAKKGMEIISKTDSLKQAKKKKKHHAKLKPIQTPPNAVPN